MVKPKDDMQDMADELGLEHLRPSQPRRQRDDTQEIADALGLGHLQPNRPQRKGDDG
jgi:hypothetical protein